MNTVCKNCGIDSRVPFVKFDERGLCDYCAGRKLYRWEADFNVNAATIAARKRDLERVYAQARGEGEYDCVMALSGGKDSSYMLYHLVEKRKLRVLAVNVTPLFESEAASDNVDKLGGKLKFAVKRITAPKEFFVEFYSKLLRNSSRYGFAQTVCSACRDFYMSQCVKVAMENNIPLVFTGFAPPRYYFFEVPKEKMERDWVPEAFKGGGYGREFLDHFWDPAKYPAGSKLPRVLSPLHLEYNIEELMRVLESEGILSMLEASSNRTNCHFSKIIFQLDRDTRGYWYGYLTRTYLAMRDMIEKKKPGRIRGGLRRLLYLIRGPRPAPGVEEARRMVRETMKMDIDELVARQENIRERVDDSFW